MSTAVDPDRPGRPRGQPLPDEPDRAARGSERRRRTLRGLSTVLISAGSLMLADAVLTVTWQEPVTALLAKFDQDGLRQDLQALEGAGATALELEALARLDDEQRRVRFLAQSLDGRLQPGDAVARVEIPSVGVDKVVVKGTGDAVLRKGPGFYADAPLPGGQGTAAIAGHRTTYGAPFRDLDDVDRGDVVRVQMPYATLTYEVEKTEIVEPQDVSVLEPTRYDRLVLTACHPLYSAAERIVVFARLMRTEPREVARGRPS